MRWCLVCGLWCFVCALPLVAAEKKPDMDKLLESRTFREGKAALPYRLMKPAGYDEDKGKRYPLVVFLHGAGERGTDNKKQLVHGVADFAKKENREKYPCFLIAPQCPDDQQWVDVPWTDKAHTMPAKPSPSAALVLSLIAALQKEFRIDSGRIYVTGLSMGGYGTWDLVCRKPELFAAAIPICGGGDEKQAKKIARVPVWVFHGDKDGAVPVERSRNMIAALKAAKGKPRYTEYAGVGHDSWTRTYADPKVIAWLFAQKK
jgi:predicted peptidase